MATGGNKTNIADKLSGLTTMVDLLHLRTSEQPDKTAYNFFPNGEGAALTLTYSELATRARAIATELTTLCGKGNRAILLYPSGLDFIEAFFGCICAGVIAVPAYPPKRNQKLDRFKSIINNSTASVILCTTKVMDLVKPMFNDVTELGNIPWIATDAVDSQGASRWQDPMVSADDLVFLQYTSGSTGNPKGVMVNHENIIYNQKMINVVAKLKPEDSALGGWLPLFHDMGLIGMMLKPFYNGYPLYFMPPSSFLQRPVRWLKLMSDYKCNITTAPNFAFDLCVREITQEQKVSLDLSKVKIACLGAETVNATTIERFYEAFSVCGLKKEVLSPCYGLAEATLVASGGDTHIAPIYKTFDASAMEQNRVVTISADADNAKTLVGNGTAILDEKIRIADTEDMTHKPDGQIGEVWVFGKNVAKGYWNNPVETQNTFGAYLAGTGEGPFMRTGDLGFILDGELFITGRIKDMMIIRGQNHYPQDIEWTVDEIAMLSKGTRPITAGACGAFSLDIDGEERLIVAVEVDRGYLPDLRDILRESEGMPKDVIPPEEIAGAIRAEIAKKHELNVYDVVLLRPYSIPKTSSGKIQRFRLRTEYVNTQLKQVWTLRDSERRAKPSVPEDQCAKFKGCDKSVCEMDRWLAGRVSVYAKLPINEIDTKREIFNYGIDSLDVINIVLELEEAIGYRVEQTVFYDHPTIQQLALYLACEAPVDGEELVVGEVSVVAKTPIDTTPPAPTPADYSDPDPQGYPDVEERHYRFDLFPRYIEWQQRLKNWQEQGIRNPYFQVNNGLADGIVDIDGRSLVNFATFNYLGLSCDKDVCQAVIDAVNKYGASVSATNPITGLTPLHKRLEAVVAGLLGCQDSLILPSGFGTNETIVGNIVGTGDLIVHDAYMHMSAIQGSLLSGARKISFPHNNWQALDATLRQERGRYKRVLVLIEGAYSMDGDIPDLPRFIEVKKRHKAFLMIDEAHSIGVLGRSGGGIGELYNVNRADVDIWMGTLSKALGSCGGYIAGSADFIQYLRMTTPGYIFGTSITPANTAAAIASIELMQREPYRVARLQYLSSLFLTLARKKKLNTATSSGTAIVPVIVGDSIRTLKLSNALFDRGFLVMPILFPAVSEDAARLRFFIMANHTEEQIRNAVEAVAEEIAKLT
ncbi:MAG: aminotransferase class I/II-fold pyridoxal phosphate-dependent enzyme [Nitrospirae bacterium]|nr:aminotransferase class I/II-fold pyridoxal phosphate-dependent enzyme [Nitrospirota bacterium]